MGLEIRRASQPGDALEIIGLWIVTEATEAEEMALDGGKEGKKDRDRALRYGFKADRGIKLGGRMEK